jgi:hypothetical protein
MDVLGVLAEISGNYYRMTTDLLRRPGGDHPAEVEGHDPV